jgi:hypothetical protein
MSNSGGPWKQAKPPASDAALCASNNVFRDHARLNEYLEDIEIERRLGNVRSRGRSPAEVPLRHGVLAEHINLPDPRCWRSADITRVSTLMYAHDVRAIQIRS